MSSFSYRTDSAVFVSI